MKNISLILLIFILASCEKTISVNLPAHESKIVVESNTYTNDTFRFRLSKSMPTMQYRPNKDYSVTNAIIVLQENSIPVDTLLFNVQTFEYISDRKAEQGKNYSVKVTAPGLPEATANTPVPSTVLIKDMKRIKEARINTDGTLQDEVRISFDDAAERGDYYVVKIKTGYTTGPHTGTIDCINTADPSVESFRDESLDQTVCLSGEGIFMRDLLFNGITKELRLFVNSYSLMPYTDALGNEVYPVIELYHVTEDCFKHVKSYRFAAENNGNPFSEPTNVHTNLSNGYGIFTVWSRDQKEIK